MASLEELSCSLRSGAASEEPEGGRKTHLLFSFARAHNHVTLLKEEP